MQNGDIIQIGSGCPATNDGLHQVEDWCRMCGRISVLNGVAADAKRYRFIRDKMSVESSLGSWCLFDSAYKGDTFNEAIDKEMERVGYEKTN